MLGIVTEDKRKEMWIHFSCLFFRQMFLYLVNKSKNYIWMQHKNQDINILKF